MAHPVGYPGIAYRHRRHHPLVLERCSYATALEYGEALEAYRGAVYARAMKPYVPGCYLAGPVRHARIRLDGAENLAHDEYLASLSASDGDR